MRPAARLQAAIELLDEILSAARNNGAAADNIARKFFAARRYAGSKDRRAVRDLTWDAIRMFGEPPATARSAFAAMAQNDAELAALFDGSPYGPAPLQADEPRGKPALLPDWIKALFYPEVGEGEWPALLERAPLDIRVNPLKISRAEAAQSIGAAQMLPSSHGMRLPRGFAADRHPLYGGGKIDIQDLGSQIIVDACAATPEMLVIDLCAGAGGKTLALAEQMGQPDTGTGRVIAADIDRGRLQKLTPRAARAGCEHLIETRLLNPGKEREMLSDLTGRADIVLVDAPCSGSGTWRRNPETRWRLTPKRLEKLTKQQAELIDIAAGLVKPDGAIVYAVCSLLAKEGAHQVSRFIEDNTGWQADPIATDLGRRCGSGHLLTPGHDGSDGFFFARLQKSC